MIIWSNEAKVMVLYQKYFWVIFLLFFGLSSPSLSQPSQPLLNLISQIYLDDPQLNNLLIQGMEKGIQGDYRGAITDFTEIIKQNNLAAEAYYNRGIAYGKINEYELAIADFNQALTLMPEAGDFYVERAKILQQLGNDQAAIADLKTALELFNDQENIYRYQETQKRLKELQSSEH